MFVGFVMFCEVPGSCFLSCMVMFWFSCARDVGLCLSLVGLLMPCLWGLVVAWLVGSCLFVEFLFRADAPIPRF